MNAPVSSPAVQTAPVNIPVALGKKKMEHPAFSPHILTSKH